MQGVFASNYRCQLLSITELLIVQSAEQIRSSGVFPIPLKVLLEDWLNNNLSDTYQLKGYFKILIVKLQRQSDFKHQNPDKTTLRKMLITV